MYPVPCTVPTSPHLWGQAHRPRITPSTWSLGQEWGWAWQVGQAHHSSPLGKGESWGHWGREG